MPMEKESPAEGGLQPTAGLSNSPTTDACPKKVLSLPSRPKDQASRASVSSSEPPNEGRRHQNSSTPTSFQARLQPGCNGGSRGLLAKHHGILESWSIFIPDQHQYYHTSGRNPPQRWCDHPCATWGEGTWLEEGQLRDHPYKPFFMSSSSSTAYHLLGQSSTDPDTELDHDEPSPDPSTINMGKRLGTFRAVYVVALCSIGSFLFAYVCLVLLHG